MAEAEAIKEEHPDEISLKTEIADGSKGQMKDDGTYYESYGGTELMSNALTERLPKDLLDEFNIIKSRVRTISQEKENILWLHDLASDPENAHLKDAELRKRFSRLVFVSDWQWQQFNMMYGINWSESFILKNAIEPILLSTNTNGTWNKDKNVIRIIYHTTPHRGLNIAVAGIKALWENGYKDKIHFDVYSSFEAYGWPKRDEPFQEIFDEIKKHEGMTYHGFKPNAVVREALAKSHIFAYPSIWQETSCIAAIEAMSAGCQVVCPNYGALPETTGGLATMYHWNENLQFHANVFANFLKGAIDNHNSEDMLSKLHFAKQWADNCYNWDIRANQWTGMLNGLKELRKSQPVANDG
tara:strand:- start:152 stop:1219 length:1068 start_codon:yes stop_codon:yes gene_type:complete